MLFSEWIREAGFWGADFLKGSSVRKHLIDVKNINENIDQPEAQRIRQSYLENILKYAAENIAYYKDVKKPLSLSSFPVVNKTIIKNNFNAFQSPEFIGKKVHDMHTSGSTGTPFLVRQDSNKRDRVYAEMIYLWGKAGYHVGIRYIFLRIWTSMNRKSSLSAWARNVLMWNTLRLDDENLEKLRRRLKRDRRIKMILGYANTYENLANYLTTCCDTPQQYYVKGILSAGEFLPGSTREKLIKIFGCPVVSIYSNQENGQLAIECVENKEFHVNSASYFIEILKFNSDEPAQVGEAGRIVVTDLFNHAMPLIRYDTGDIGIWKEKAECGWKTRVMASIEGGMVDMIYDTAGKAISPHAVNVTMWPYDKLKQFQFIQTGQKHYLLKLNGSREHYRDSEFVDLFKQTLGGDAEISIEHVDEIPVLNSGKRKIVVSTYKRNDSPD